MQAHIHQTTGKKYYLGKGPHIPDHRDLLLKDYIDKATLINATQAPAAVDWTAIPTVTGAKPLPDTDDLGNAGAGDCVLAAPGHAVNLIGQQTGDSSLVVTKGMTLAAYSKYTGYVAGEASTDNGWYVRSMLKAWMRDGLYNTKALAFAAVNWHDPEEVALAVWLSTGAVIGGYSLPKEVWDQTDAYGQPQWFVPPGGCGPSIGGHCMCQHGVRNWNTWGESAIADQPWVDANCDELYMVIVDRSRLTTGQAPNGFDFQQLLLDVQARQAA
jgi:hypothetical protein